MISGYYNFNNSYTYNENVGFPRTKQYCNAKLYKVRIR